MAYVKIITIHNSPNAVMKYTKNKDKTTNKEIVEPTLKDDLADAFSYTTNPTKTTKEKLMYVTGFNCNPKTAETEFKMVRDNYKRHKKEILPTFIDKDGNIQKQQPVQAYHLIQSFDPKDKTLTPAMVHKMGVEFAESLGNYQAVVSTHLDKEHLHNHIVFNAYAFNSISKYKSDKAALEHLREISDNIALKYGFSTIEDPDMEHGYRNWKEVILDKEGKSWKGHIKDDIIQTMEVSKNFEEYKTIMEKQGYSIKENPKTIVYTKEFDGIEHCIRDKRLGKECTKAELKNYWNVLNKDAERDLDYIKETLPKEKTLVQKNEKIYVSRYTLAGRRRSDLEMIVILAIKLIKKLKDLFQKKDVSKEEEENPIFKPFNWRLQQMIQTLQVITDEKIESKEDLKKQKQDFGYKVAEITREIESKETFIEESKSFFKDAKELEKYINTLRDLGADLERLEFETPTVEEKRIIRAKLNPCTPEQKTELFQATTENKFYKLEFAFDCYTKNEVKNIIDFLNGKVSEMPDGVLTYEASLKRRTIKKFEKILNDRNERLKEQNSKKEPSEKIKKYVLKLLTTDGKALDIDTLNTFDCFQIMNYYSKNPFSKELLTKEQKDLLEDKKDLIHRPLETVTKKEAEELIKYFEEPKKTKKPSLLNEFEEMKESLKTNLGQLLTIREEGLSFDLSLLSKEEGEKLYTYLINKGNVPECMKAPEEEKNTYLYNLDLDTQSLATEYIDIVNRLKLLNVNTLEDANIFIKEVEDISNKLDLEREQLDDVKSNYKKYTKILKNIELAENPKFTHGPNFDIIEEKEEVIEEQVPEKTKEEEQELEKDLKKEKEKKVKKL